MFGHVLVVAGSRGMTGAAALCAAAALRSGAGLVTVAVPRSQQSVLARRGPREAMTLPLPESGGVLSAGAAGAVLAFIRSRGVTSLALGPGLRVMPGTRRAVKEILERAGVPAVADADALNALAAGGWPRGLSGPVAVTPHPGELARLLGISVRAVQSDRPGAARRLARARGVICVLKGAGTLVTDGRLCLKNSTGNAGLAKGGSGDVLTGVIAALAGQTSGADPAERLWRACATGVHIHGAAADRAAREKTRIGLTAGDVIEALPRAFRAAFGTTI
jgi:ADP-dependent NAD(P)H-hydrate dehydratase / NAD(P)H-hydrate epimerase